MEVIKTFRDPLTRQIEEASRIQETAEHPGTLNRRSEWRSTPLPQVGFTQGRVPQGSRPIYVAARDPVPVQGQLEQGLGLVHGAPAMPAQTTQLAPSLVQVQPLPGQRLQHQQAHHPSQDPLWGPPLIPRVPNQQHQHPQAPPTGLAQDQHPRVPTQEPQHQDPRPRRDGSGCRRSARRKNH